MDAPTLQRIFEPFFTTKPESKGTGLGLSTAYGLVQAFNGTISVASELGRGTTFSICLQRAPSPSESFSMGSSSNTRGGSETILVAEDSKPIRMLVSQVLGAQGYTVLEAADGAAALQAAEGHAGDIQLLVTDVLMPGLSGFELADQLRERRPNLKVLVMTGLAERARINDFATLAKPFTPMRLSERVRHILDSA